MCSNNNEDQIIKRELEIENTVLIQNINQFKKKIQEKENYIKELELENKELKIVQENFYDLQEKYNKIIYSRSYKIAKKIMKIIKGK